MALLEIDDEVQLHALHLAIMEAKFRDDPDHKEVLGSPIVSQIANNVVEALKQVPGAYVEPIDWEEWRIADTHTEILRTVKKRLLSDGYWNEVEDKKKYLEDAFAPLLASKELKESLIKEIDEQCLK